MRKVLLIVLSAVIGIVMGQNYMEERNRQRCMGDECDFDRMHNYRRQRFHNALQHLENAARHQNVIRGQYYENAPRHQNVIRGQYYENAPRHQNVNRGQYYENAPRHQNVNRGQEFERL